MRTKKKRALLVLGALIVLAYPHFMVAVMGDGRPAQLQMDTAVAKMDVQDEGRGILTVSSELTREDFFTTSTQISPMVIRNTPRQHPTVEDFWKHY